MFFHPLLVEVPRGPTFKI